MTFIEAIKSGFRNYATFRGRASRSEFWFFMLFCVLAMLVASVLDVTLFAAYVATDGGGLLSLITLLVTILPSIAVSVRRLHDSNHSGWWYLLNFLPIIGLVLIYFYCINPDEGRENRFGTR